ncbi:uncharacterized protein LOC117114049 isoform X1 [Anneissia japonica]|uniref:uncharacterized protein LOC117114049 isoform X1 n=1 Tax=Anneissia japonica TaxID=1529436 RepID=UPI0014255D3B|nr:uncharacterized protein LOC117114049 isoform X1 [Anneissia japonica]
MDSSLPNCLLTLKALKRKYINYEESNEPTPFCSYYIKTACFWIYETFPHKECSIMNLIRELLNWLIDCYQHGNLPHYFIPSQNLIGYLSEKVRYEVQEKLKAVNSKKKIWSMVMSCVVLDYEVINVVCDKLGIAKVCEGDDFQQLETDLLHHPNAKVALEYYIQGLSPDGLLYDRSQYRRIVQCLSVEDPILLNALQTILDYPKFDILEILAFPEKVILPIIDTIDDLLPYGYAQMFRQYLYRHLGDVYTYLLIYLQARGFLNDCNIHLIKPMLYYTLGTEIVLLDKWSDNGEGGIVRTAKYHYLMGDYENLKPILRFIGPKMKPNIKSFLYMSRHIPIEIKTLYLPLSSWAADKKLRNLAIVSITPFYLHPVVFVFYMQARVALKEGDMEKASSNLKDMKECTPIIAGELKKNAMSLIRLIENEINPPNRYL